MKILPRFLLCFLFLLLGKATAQDTFAPLISENCVAFVHVDLRKVELDHVKTFLQKTGEELLQTLGFDERSFNATSRELADELEKLDILIRPYFDTITKELDIREFAIIADMRLISPNAGGILTVIPWKDKTNEHLETLAGLLQVPPDHLFVNKGFLFIHPPWFYESVEGWLEELTPAKLDSPILEALKSVAGAEIKVAVALPETARQMIRTAPLPPDMPDEVKNLLLFAAQRINWASASLSLTDIFGTEKPVNSDVLMTFKLSNVADAETLRELMDKAIDVRLPFPDEVPPLVGEFMKGYWRTFLPDAEEDKLIFRLKNVKTVGAGVLPVGAFLSLPMFVPRRVVSPQPADAPFMSW